MSRNGQDVAVAADMVERGLASAEDLSTLDGPPGSLARTLIERQLVPAPLVSLVVRELGAGRFVCPGCAKSVVYAGLGKLRSLNCPGCPNQLEYRSPEQRAQPAGVPERVGPYRVVREVGRGGMGVVYEGRDGRGETVAIKVVLGFGADHAERFQVEAAVASRLDHPGIVPVRDVGVHAGRPYYVMDFVEGRTLAQRLRESGALPPHEAAQLAWAMGSAVAAAHDAGVVHRDLKPGNVILRASTGEPVITDFGLARDLNRSMGMTRSGEVLGTPHYMAPEQMEDAKRAGTEADVYALGVILYECLSGRRPYEANALLDLYNQIQRGGPPPLREWAPGTPPALARACLQALARDPKDRPVDARAFVAALEAEGPRAQRPGGGRAVGLAAGGLGLLLLAGAAIALVIAQRVETGVQLVAPATATPTPSAVDSPRIDLFERALEQVDGLHKRSAPYPEIESRLNVAASLARTSTQRSRVTRARLELAFRRLRLEETLRLARSPDLLGRAAQEGRLIEGLTRYRRREKAEAKRNLKELARADTSVIGATAAAFLSQWEDPSRGPDPKVVERALRLDPSYPLARLTQFLRLSLRTQDYAGAEAVMRDLLQAAPDHYLLLWSQVTLLRRREGDAGAVGALDRLVALVQPEPFPEAILVRSQLQARLNDWPGALAGMNKVLGTSAYRDDLEALLFRGALRGRSGDKRGRQDDFVRAALTHPAEFYAEAKRQQQPGILRIAMAGLRWRSVVQLTPELKAALKARGSQLPAEARGSLLEASALLMRGSLWSSQISDLLASARAAAPRSFRVALQRTELFGGRQRHVEARAALEEAKRLAPQGDLSVSQTLERLEGDLAAARGEIALAREAYRRVAKGSGVNGRLARVALGLMADEVPKQLEAEAGRLLREAPQEPRAYALAALIAYIKNQPLTALSFVQRGLQRVGALDGNLLATQALVLCELEGRLGRRAAALRELEWGFPYGGGGLRANGVARVLLSKRLRPEDLAWSRKVLLDGLGAEPRRPSLHRLLGSVCLLSKRPAEETLAHFERAKQLYPGMRLKELMANFRRRYPADVSRLAARLAKLEE